MKVTVELVYDDATRNRKVDVEVKDGLKGARLLDAIDVAVAKKEVADKDWQRWNLISVS